MTSGPLFRQRGLADLFADADYDCDGTISESEFFALAEDMGYDGAMPQTG